MGCGFGGLNLHRSGAKAIGFKIAHEGKYSR